MEPREPLLTSDSIRMLISSVTNSGQSSLTELEAERLLNAIARAQSGVPTGPWKSQQGEGDNDYRRIQ